MRHHPSIRSASILVFALGALILAAGTVRAQAPSTSSSPASAMKAGGKVEGVIVDEAGKPLEAVTLNLLHAADSSMAAQGISGKAGQFSFGGLQEGHYLLSVTAAGRASVWTAPFAINASKRNISLNNIVLSSKAGTLGAVSVVARKPYLEQKADRMIVNVDASPSNTGSSVMDVLEKSPGVTVDKDGNISLKGRQGVTIMIDDKPTYMSGDQLASYLKGLPASAIDQLEIMTNPSAKYDAAGNSGIINLKTKKNKARGFNGALTLTHTQGVYPRPGGSLNLNYRNGKFNVFFNGGAAHWEGFQNLDLTRRYFDAGDKTLTSIFTQQTRMKYTNPETNAKFGVDYYLDKKTTLGIVLTGFSNSRDHSSDSRILLKDPAGKTDSIVYSPSKIHGNWKNGTVNLNFRRQIDSTGRELTADVDYARYSSGSDQYFDNTTYLPDWTKKSETILTGNLPSDINIYSFKSDYTHPFSKSLKLEAGIKSSYVTTDNTADYFNIINGQPQTDTNRTNHFLYRENINAAYLNLNRQYKKWGIQAGLRLENTNYSGHQLGNGLSEVNKDSSFSRSYTNLFPTLYVSYQANAKNQFSLNYGRRIDRPAYQDLNPFLFFLDQYTYEAGNPYLQPQFSHNVELTHTYNSFLTTTLNYGFTENFFTETFQQQGQATIVRKGNIGRRQTAGIAVSVQRPVVKWWTLIAYANLNYNSFSGMLYGEDLSVDAVNLTANLNNQLKFAKGWGAELSGWYRSRGVEGQVMVNPMGSTYLALTKQIWKEQGNLKLGIRDIFYTQGGSGHINFQQTEASFHNAWDSREISCSFTWRFGKPIKDTPARRDHGAGDEESRVKVGGH